MLSSALIIFREILEIALILGVLIAATRGLPSRNKLIGIGLLLGIVGSTIVAFFAEAISDAAEGMGQEVFNAFVLLAAGALIGWTVVWMRRNAKTLTKHLKEVGEAVSRGDKPLYSLSVVVLLAVLREGSEIVLFISGIYASGESISAIILGSLIGLALGTLAGVAIYFGLIKLSTRLIFTVTSWLLIFVAAGMVSEAFGYLGAGGFVPEITTVIWDTSNFLSDHSLLGQILHTLVGYTARPSGMQLISYFITLIGMLITLELYGNASPRPERE